MTKNEAINKVINEAKSNIGYLEKQSNDDLDNPTSNIGSKNYTKYARDFFPDLQGLEWCCMFVFACFAYQFGKIQAMNLLGECKTAKCSILYDAMKSKKEVIDIKEVTKGDLIFFHKEGNINHIGIIEKVDKDKIITIEGNTSVGNNVVIESGGGVYEKTYTISNPRIYGIARPKWEYVSKETDENDFITNPTTEKISLRNDIGYINGNEVNIRKGPGLNYDSIDKVNKGLKVKILNTINDKYGTKWYEVSYSNKNGYVRYDLVNL